MLENFCMDLRQKRTSVNFNTKFFTYFGNSYTRKIYIKILNGSKSYKIKTIYNNSNLTVTKSTIKQFFMIMQEKNHQPHLINYKVHPNKPKKSHSFLLQAIKP